MESVACTDISDSLSGAVEEMDTSRVTVSKNELPAIQWDIINAVQDLEEQVHKLNRMTGRACAVVNIRHVGHVAVIWQVVVDAVPARLELYLSTETVIAVCHAQVWRFGIR